MPDPGMPKSLYNALGAFQGVRIGGSVPVTESPDTRATTDPNMPKSLYPPNSALGAFQGAAPALGTPLNWALAPSGISLEYVLRHKIMSAQQQLGIPQGFNPGHAGMSQMSTLPFLASMPGATDLMQNRGMASSSFAEDSQSGIWRQASGYEQQVSVMSRSKGGVDRRVLLTRALLANYFHESLDTVAEKMGVSKTTLKAACRRLGLVKWPYRHCGPRKTRKPSLSAILKQEDDGESVDEKETEGGAKRSRRESETAEDMDLNESMAESDKNRGSKSDNGSKSKTGEAPFGKHAHGHHSGGGTYSGETRVTSDGGASGQGRGHVTGGASYNSSERGGGTSRSVGDSRRWGGGGGGGGRERSTPEDIKVTFHALLNTVSPSGSDSSENEEHKSAHERMHKEEAEGGQPSPKRRKVGEEASSLANLNLIEMKEESQRWCEAVRQAHAAREDEAATQDTAMPAMLAELPYFLREADWAFLHQQTKGKAYFAEGLVVLPITRTLSTPAASPGEHSNSPLPLKETPQAPASI